MAVTITDDGVLVETLGERVTRLQAAFRSTFPPIAGEQLDLSADSYTGRETNILGEEFITAQNLLVGLVELLDPSNAQGAFVDFHLSLQATERKPATRSTAPAIVYGLPGTAVGDKRVRYLPTSTLWRTPAGLVIGPTGETETTLTAVDTGPVIALETGTDQWLIVDVTNGWDAVETTADANAGTVVESDSEARVRVERSAASVCTGTAPAILRRLLMVPGVISARVYNNRTLLPDANGVPAKSIESVVDGGTDDDVAAAILHAYNGSAGFAGTSSVTTTVQVDIGGGQIIPLTRTVRFSRIERVPIVAQLTITVLDSSLLPEDFEDVVKAAVSSWLNSLDPDIDVIPEAVEAQVWAALPSGSISDVSALIAVKDTPLAAVTIPLAIRQRASTNAEPQAAVVQGTQVQPFNLTITWTLVVAVDGGVPQTITFQVSDFALVSAATALEVASAINRQVTGFVAGVDEGALTLTSNTQGSGSSIQILNTSTPQLLTTLGLTVGTTTGSNGDIELIFV